MLFKVMLRTFFVKIRCIKYEVASEVSHTFAVTTDRATTAVKRHSVSISFYIFTTHNIGYYKD